MTENYKVGIYLRLSREDERLGESASIGNQREQLLNYIRDNNLLFVDEYVDDGVSGTTFDRAGFKRMIDDRKAKRINMIITKDTSRLGRDHIEFGYYVERFFPENNIRYVAVNDGIDTSINTSANDMLVFKSAFNDMYVKDISNKLRSSLYTKKRNGEFVGAYAPYGYNKSPVDKHKLVVNEEEACVVRRIFNMFKNGESLSVICDTLTTPSKKCPHKKEEHKCCCHRHGEECCEKKKKSARKVGYIKAGGDIITKINDRDVKAMDDIIAYLSSNTSIGDTITLHVIRDGKEMDVDLTLAARPTAAQRHANAVAGTEEEETEEQEGGKASLGVYISDQSDVSGVLVNTVMEDSAAADAGMEEGDIITSFDGVEVNSVAELKDEIAKHLPGERVTVTVERDGESQDLRLTLGNTLAR